MRSLPPGAKTRVWPLQHAAAAGDNNGLRRLLRSTETGQDLLRRLGEHPGKFKEILCIKETLAGRVVRGVRVHGVNEDVGIHEDQMSNLLS